MRFPKSFAVLALIAAALPARGQTVPPAGEAPSVLSPASRPAQGTDAGDPLGAAYDNELAAITFRPPLGMKHEPRVVGGAATDVVATFVDTVRKHKLTLTQMRYPEPTPLMSPKGNLQIGLLERRVEALKEAPGAEVLKSDLVTVGFRSAKNEPDTGLIYVRYPAGTADLFSQEAIIEVSPYEYYLLDYTVPGMKAGSGADQGNEDELRAFATFRGLLDTVKIVDRSEVLMDQKERLIHTRFLLLNNLPATRIRIALHAEQWYRIVKDGKDVGYSYVIEEEGEKSKHVGVNVGMRSRVIENGEQTDAESFFFVSYDRAYEEWSTVSQVTGGKDKPHNMTELGTSIQTKRKVPDTDAVRIAPDPDGSRGPLTKEVTDYDLTVVYSGRQSTPTVEQKLPPFYVPAALVHLLPRLVALDGKTYCFAVYDSDLRAVIREYLDVGKEGTYTLDGKQIRAVPVTTRLGLQGSPTTHYVTRKGEYLGSVNEAAKTMLVPCDRDALEKLWANPDLSKPKPAPKPPGGSLTPGR